MLAAQPHNRQAYWNSQNRFSVATRTAIVNAWIRFLNPLPHSAVATLGSCRDRSFGTHSPPTPWDGRHTRVISSLMPSQTQGSIHLFRFAGVDVYLHWSWFLVAVFEINSRVGRYSSITWNILEYLSLFLIVLFHEYGHARACMNVGGRVNHIVLWPLGGVAYVDPPPRPAATLWSIAAGPLVNVVLFPMLLVALIFGRAAGLPAAAPNLYALIRAVSFINVGLLVFNLVPIYPLDGGQILRALLWFVMGRARSLMVAALIGLVGVAGLIVLAVRVGSVWFGVMSAFILLNCWAGLKQSLALLRLAKLPHRGGFACPSCQASPPIGYLWTCGACRTMFDIFETQGSCPYCATPFASIRCLECGQAHSLPEWAAAASNRLSGGGIGYPRAAPLPIAEPSSTISGSRE